ncbi:signal peptide peptidase-domain-containing protein [Hypoxylon cercidicola]|nr:signal peptide peptidase-domain-containing protein [Hypoxylon cercidicola]
MASNDSTPLAGSEKVAANITESILANQTFTEKLSSLPIILWENRDLFLLECRIIFTAMACIYIGSHAALRRPPSANPPKRGKKGESREQRDEEEKFVQGLLPSDAILFPVLAGVILVGLYYLIKWLEDPDILNKILKIYFSSMSLASMGKLFADSLHFMTGFVFPTVWTTKDGKLYHVDQSKKGQWHKADDSQDPVYDDKKKSPLPGRWSELSLSESSNGFLWEVRRLLLEQWTVRLSIHGVVNEAFKVRFNDISGTVLAVAANVLYHTTESTFLSNVMGYAFSYAGIILMSPTTFGTGTAVLFGLFFYDIYMVFYTPYMVTVATKLEVPIKLVFEGPTKSSMLGLGDIVLPGIFVALCLRFDHYMYYYRQRKLVPVELKFEDETSGQLVSSTKTQRMVVKPDYVNPKNQWGDWFWSTRLGKKLSPDTTSALKASAFPKTYFYTAMVGYLLAMVMTLAMLLVYRHAQPALLYLVPGVIFAVWLTGTVRGELREMWAYTEDGRLDTVDTIVDVDGDGNVIDIVNDKKDDDKIEEKQKTETNADVKSDIKTEGNSGKEKRYPVFLFSIEAPAPRAASDSKAKVV